MEENRQEEKEGVENGDGKKEEGRWKRTGRRRRKG